MFIHSTMGVVNCNKLMHNMFLHCSCFDYTNALAVSVPWLTEKVVSSFMASMSTMDKSYI